MYVWFIELLSSLYVSLHDEILSEECKVTFKTENNNKILPKLELFLLYWSVTTLQTLRDKRIQNMVCVFTAQECLT